MAEYNWFYNLDGEQIGPVSHKDIMNLLEQNTVNADTLVWRASMDDWLPLQRVDELKFETQTPPPLPWEDEADTVSEVEAETKNDIVIEKAEFKTDTNDAASSMDNTYQERFLSVEGRIRRRVYLGRLLVLGIPAYFISYSMEGVEDPVLVVLMLVLVIVFSIFQIFQFIKRLHDINMKGAWWLIQLIPFVNLLFGLYVLFTDGTSGPNNFGPDPKGRVG